MLIFLNVFLNKLTEFILLYSSKENSLSATIVFCTLTDSETPDATKSLNDKPQLLFYKNLFHECQYFRYKKKTIFETISFIATLFSRNIIFRDKNTRI